MYLYLVHTVYLTNQKKPDSVKHFTKSIKRNNQSEKTIF